MKNFLKILKKHSRKIVAIIIIIFLIIIGIMVKNFFFPDDAEAYYGTRIEGIEKVKISDKKITISFENVQDLNRILEIMNFNIDE